MTFKTILASAAALTAAIASTSAAMALDTNSSGSDQNLRYTRAYVERAYDMLSHDQADYGGHRVAAMNDIAQARADLATALRYDNNAEDSTIPVGVRPQDADLAAFERGQAASNRNIEFTRTYLQRAIDMLVNDAHDYGGYRAKAVSDLRAARDQLQAAIAFRDEHAESAGTASDENLRYTRRYVERAYDMLSHDQADYGGHRVEAMADITRARADLATALHYDNNAEDSTVPIGVRPQDTDLAAFERGQVASDQNIIYTRKYLERAIDMLLHDAHDYGGYRAKAVIDLKSARDQLSAAIAFRDAHESAQVSSDENLRFSRLYIERAADMLEHDARDYGGHRAAAVTDIINAREDLTTALRYDANHEDSNLPSTALAGDEDLDRAFVRGDRASDQNIAYVRRYLERAIDMLSEDQHDYGGYRVKAIADLRAARQQLALALQTS